jgi:leucyl aminopeptidase (aminopeptidase T)
VDLAMSLVIGTNFYDEASKREQRLLLLCGADEDLLARGIAGHDLSAFDRFGELLRENIPAGSRVRLTSPGGSRFEFTVGSEVVGAGAWVFPGQENFFVEKGSASGTLVVDAGVFPPVELSRLRSSLVLEFREGRIAEIRGEQAAVYRAWLESQATPDKWYPFHFSFGFNPGIDALRRDVPWLESRGTMLEDERIWGAVNVGLGFRSDGWHSDTVILGGTVTSSNREILRDGRYMVPELVAVFGRS